MAHPFDNDRIVKSPEGEKHFVACAARPKLESLAATVGQIWK
jgi:hypothetical protein